MQVENFNCLFLPYSKNGLRGLLHLAAQLCDCRPFRSAKFLRHLVIDVVSVGSYVVKTTFVSNVC